jgi:hypothetical protein
MADHNFIPSTQNYGTKCLAARLIFGFVMRQRLERLRQSDSVLGLGEIDADKTMRLLDKLWAKRADQRSKYKEGPLYYLPVDPDLNAKHGHRVGFVTSGSIDECQPVLDIMLRFDEGVSPTARILSVHQMETEWGELRVFEPQVSAAKLIPLVNQQLIDQDDIEFLEKAGQSFGSLEPDEIIALGRHESGHKSQNAILWELDRWVRSTARALSSLKLLTSGATNDEYRQCANDVWSSVSFAYECLKKAGISGDVYDSDRHHYQKALEKMRRSASSDLLLLINDTQPAADSIWESAEVRDVKLAAFAAWVFSVYLFGLRRLTAFAGSEITRRFKKVSDDRLREADTELRILLTMDADWQPASFARATFMNAPRGSLLVEPAALPADGASLEAFARAIEPVFDEIVRRFVQPKLDDWRIQGV